MVTRAKLFEAKSLGQNQIVYLAVEMASAGEPFPGWCYAVRRMKSE